MQSEGLAGVRLKPTMNEPERGPKVVSKRRYWKQYQRRTQSFQSTDESLSLQMYELPLADSLASFMFNLFDLLVPDEA
jgi:hypothetical protein